MSSHNCSLLLTSPLPAGRRRPARRILLGVAVLVWSAPLLLGEDWPQLLGPRRDGSAQVEHLPVPWPESGPTTRWSKKVGEGFAGPAVVLDRVLLFHRLGGEEVLEALAVNDGRVLWRSAHATVYRDDFGFNSGPRATPTVAGGRVFTHGAAGVLSATDLNTGRLLWQRDLFAELAVAKGFFGVANAPVVEGELLLLAPGGTKGSGIVALDVATGKTIWSATNDEASYSSPIVVDHNQRRSALFFTREGLVELDPKSGALRSRFVWKTRIRSSVNAATPLFVDGKVFLSASYGAGAVLVDLDAGTPRGIWSGDESLSNHYATAVHFGGFLYGFHGRQESRPALRCVEFETGKVRWSVDRFGAGSVLLVGQKVGSKLTSQEGARLLVLREDGELQLLEATPEKYSLLARATILSSETRAVPALANRVLYARDAVQLVAIELP